MEEFFVDAELKTIHIVMPMSPRGDLLTYLIERKRVADLGIETGITENEVRTTAHQICDAMRHVHALGLIHYDLKPEEQNILVFSAEPLWVKVADFGLADRVAPGMLTQKNYTIGSASYMAPEIVRCRPHNNKADSWGVGVIVHAM
ncbi:putative myosin light chain kinase [Psilocybe cubensis]|uniref:Myosin light chain kinase n=2 Tax=Psilocybe cubensis TaxID=181762 RepID=A0ACB8H280_PSICU|nr:putative myosin light chain kinase [Psilocybe cubensis]KAH9481772.1 putative myosin light chain kinase [Psilocybe cubensis]